MRKTRREREWVSELREREWCDVRTYMCVCVCEREYARVYVRVCAREQESQRDRQTNRHGECALRKPLSKTHDCTD